MKHFLLLLSLVSLSFALDISIKVAKEDFNNYATLHLKHTSPFTCRQSLDPLENVTSIVCIFSKRPTKRFKPIKNSFYKIYSNVRDKKFYLIIKPFEKMKLVAMITDLSKSESSFEADISESSHWMVIAYKDKIPFIDESKKSAFSINFPVNIKSDATPYVGALDINAKPVSISNVQDVSNYLELKHLYSIKKYEQVLELCDETIENFKDSIFLSDVMLYKIRSLHHLDESEEVIELAKVYMRENSSSSSMPEVLAYTARAYSKIGLYIDADYFYDRLFDEHDDSRFSKLAMIFKAEQLDDAGNSKKAVEYFKKALYSTKDMAIAAYAAFKISEYEVDHKRAKEASKYITKISEKKSDYFFENRVASTEMAEKMYDMNEFYSSYLILKNLLKNLKKSDDDYERLLKNIIVTLSKTDKVDITLDYIEQYNKSFKYGDYLSEVEIAKDSLFFDKKDLNVSAKLQEYNTLIEKYNSDKIGDKALYKKAKLLFANARYQEVLDLNSSLASLESSEYSDTNTLITQSAQNLLMKKLEVNVCKDVVDLYKRYALAPFEEMGVYNCAREISHYQLAKDIAKKYLHVKNLDTRITWLYRYIDVLYDMREYKELIVASNDYIALASKDKYNNIYRLRFDAFKSLKQDINRINSITKIEDNFGLDTKDIERFSSMISLGQKMGDDVMIENYARKVIRIQERANIHSQTPFVEFSLIEALGRNKKSSEAIKVLQMLIKEDIKVSSQARAHYLLGSLYLKAEKIALAKKEFEASVSADAKSAWAKLAKDALSLL